jgi:hypothetical protein
VNAPEDTNVGMRCCAAFPTYACYAVLERYRFDADFGFISENPFCQQLGYIHLHTLKIRWSGS